VGRSHADAPEIDGSVRVTGKTRVGDFANVWITDAGEYDLTGETLCDATVAGA
jgi:tRNA A37 methylthiotransferase MiaB